VQPANRSQPGAGKSFWQLFADAGYDRKIELACQMLATESYLNEATLRDLLQRLYRQSIEEDARARFDEIVECLRRHQPRVYEAMAGTLLDWCLANALADDRLDDVARLGRELAARAAAEPGALHDNLERLAYHGHLRLMVEMMKMAWPEIQAAASAAPGSRAGFAARTTDAIIFLHLEQVTAASAEDPALLAELETFFPVSTDRLDQYMAFVSGDIQAQWRPEHFALPAGGEPAPPATVQNLQTLALAFIGHLRREEEVNYSKGELARPHLPRYLLDRHSGVLDAREPLGDLMRQGVPPLTSRLQPQPPAHVLCPDRETFQRYLDRLLVAGNPQPYRAAALFELMPAWLRYLEAHGLIEAQQRQRSLQEVAALSGDMVAIWSNYTADPALLEAVQKGSEALSVELLNC
jgi:hypothetical protein